MMKWIHKIRERLAFRKLLKSVKRLNNVPELSNSYLVCVSAIHPPFKSSNEEFYQHFQFICTSYNKSATCLVQQLMRAADSCQIDYDSAFEIFKLAFEDIVSNLHEDGVSDE